MKLAEKFAQWAKEYKQEGWLNRLPPGAYVGESPSSAPLPGRGGSGPRRGCSERRGRSAAGCPSPASSARRRALAPGPRSRTLAAEEEGRHRQRRFPQAGGQLDIALSMAAFGHVMAVEHQPGQALGQVGDEGLRRPAVGAGRAPEEIEVDLGLTPLIVAQPGALQRGGADGCPTQEEEERQKKVAEVAGSRGVPSSLR